MKKVERLLKKQADSILPDQELKQSIMSQVPFQVSNKPQPRRLGFLINSLIAVSIVVAISLMILFPTLLNKNKQTNTFVSIDINPSFEIVADENDIVVKVNALNQDAVLVLYKENFIGQSLDTVTKKIVKLSFDLGFVATNGVVNIVAVNDNVDKENSIGQLLTTAVQDTLNTNKVDATVKVNGDVSIDLAKEYGVTVGRAKLLQDAIEKLGLTLNELKDLDSEEINRQLKNYSQTLIDNALSQIEDYFLSIGYNDQISDKNTQLTTKKQAKEELEEILDWLEEYGEGKHNINQYKEKLSDLIKLYPNLNINENISYGKLKNLLEDRLEYEEDELDRLEDELEETQKQAKKGWQTSHKDDDDDDNNDYDNIEEDKDNDGIADGDDKDDIDDNENNDDNEFDNKEEADDDNKEDEKNHQHVKG